MALTILDQERSTRRKLLEAPQHTQGRTRPGCPGDIVVSRNSMGRTLSFKSERLPKWCPSVMHFRVSGKQDKICFVPVKAATAD
jgi:hypothetical protein